MSDSDRKTLATTGGEHAVSTATVPALADTISADASGDPVLASVPRKRIGRYQIVSRLGAGGMGEVWEATDPDLGRGVAIKVLHQARGGNLRLAERLRREAQALARLHHPNVVAVYDVGVDDGELYIVMQLVNGVTLDRALERGHTLPEIVELLALAGRGLGAAHAAGIVHRDFKPTNVLVGSDGTPRVTDFGLARASESADDAAEIESVPGLATSMTRGELVGTPAYMAPEQFRGGPVTHATDQFSFCVTLWEALAGERPFAGHDVASLREAVLGAKRRELPARVPRRIRAALGRGLSLEPSARFASMSDLLEELLPQRRALWIAGGVGVAALATTAILLGATRTARDPCKGIEAPADAVWNDMQREAVRTALGDAAPAVISRLDSRTVRWKASRRDACEATHVRDDQDERLLRQRYLCLERSLADQRAAIGVIAGKVNPLLIRRARNVVDGGLDPDDCSRTKAPANAPGLAIDANEALYSDLAQVGALFDAGRYGDVLAREVELGARIVATNDPGLVAKWFFLIGRTHQSNEDLAGAAEPLRRAAEAGMRAGKDEIVAHAQATLAVVMAELGDLKGVDAVLASAKDAAARSGSSHAENWIEDATARIALERGELPQALAICKRMLDRGEHGGFAELVESGLECTVDVELQDRDFAAAVVTATRLVEERTKSSGADHPTTIAAVQSLVLAKIGLGDPAGAKPLWDRVLRDTERLYGRESLEVMDMLRDFAAAMSPGGAMSTPEAGAAITRAVAIAEKVLPPKDPQRSAIFEAQAYVEGALGHRDAASAAWRKAIAGYELLDDPLGLTRSLYNAADLMRTGGRCDQAIPLYRRAAHVAEETGKKSLMGAVSMGSIGACLGGAKQWAEAEAVLGAAIAELDALGEVVFAAQSRWELADQLIKRGQRAKGIAIAKAAADQLTGRPPPADALKQQIVEWIAKP